MFNNLLFVCVGNVCRSPMAEGYFREQLKNKNIKIASAGIRALVGRLAVSEAQKLTLEIGIDISSHRAQQINEELVSNADLIFTMEGFQKKEIEFIFPYARGKVHLLGKWGGFEIPDPYQESMEAFADCLKLIEKGWKDWQNRLVK
jgi:protein-tyrosine phosphatase